MPREEVDPKIVERIKGLIVRNPFILLTDLKKKAGCISRDRLELHLREIEEDPAYSPDLRAWKRNVDFKPPRQPLVRKPAEHDTAPKMKRVPHLK